MERIFFLLLLVILPLVLAQSCQLFDDNPWRTLSHLSIVPDAQLQSRSLILLRH